MLLDIKVITNAKKNALKDIGGVVKVYITATPVKGKANKALVKFLADHFKVRRSDISIVKGEKSSHKTINITDKQ